MQHTPDTITTDILQSYSEIALLSALFEKGCRENYPLAAWQLPGSTTRQVAVQLSPPQTTSEAIEDLKPGFMVGAFEDTGAPHYITADLLFSFREGKITAPPSGNLQLPKVANFLRELTAGMQEPGTMKFRNWFVTDTPPSESGNNYREQVQEAISAIQAGRFRKVVLSRTSSFPTGDRFNPVATFLKLCKQYPNCFIALVSLPGTGTWITASPETLIRVENNRFTTTALAATQPYTGISVQEASWKQKEIEEQALVSRYIINCFKKIRLREFDDIGPKTIIAGNLMHLQTEFVVDMKEVNFPDLGSTMLRLLHPTSAVCGMPKEPALAFIKATENYDRSLYAGFLGPVNMHHATHLFVNLRCMQLARERAILYAGAGITEGSDPEKEWEETTYKFDTLLSVLKQ